MSQTSVKCALCPRSPQKECSFCGHLVCKACARHKYYNRSLKKATPMCDLCYADRLRGGSRGGTPAKNSLGNDLPASQEVSVSLSEEIQPLHFSKELADLQRLNNKSTEDLRELRHLQQDSAGRRPSSRLLHRLHRRLGNARVLVETLRRNSQIAEVQEETERFYSLEGIYTELCQGGSDPFAGKQCKVCCIQ